MSSQRQLKTTREQVVNAALRVVDEAGVDGLTIRAVAAAAGTPPMSLYTHFAKKEQLLDLMYEEIAQRIYPGPELTTWPAALSGFCHNLRQVLLDHPQWTPLVSRPAAVLSLPARERLLSLMTQSGISAERALAMLSSAGLLALGLTTVEQSYRDEAGVSQFARRLENLRTRSEDPAFVAQNPVTRQALKRSSRLDLSEHFRSVVTAFIAGLELQVYGHPDHNAQ